MSVEHPIDGRVDLDDGSARAVVTERRVLEIGDPLDENGELRLQRDPEGWPGYVREESNEQVGAILRVVAGKGDKPRETPIPRLSPSRSEPSATSRRWRRRVSRRPVDRTLRRGESVSDHDRVDVVKLGQRIRVHLLTVQNTATASDCRVKID